MIRRAAGTLLMLCVVAGPVRADEQMFSSVYWPRSVSLRLAPRPAASPLPARNIWRSDLSKSDPFPDGGRPGGKPAAPGARPSPAASADPAAARRLQETARATDREMRDVERGLIELAGSAGDLVRVALSSSKKQLLRPLLLFLVERGVLLPAEVDVWMQAEDVQPLLDRVKLAVERLEDRRDALEVRRYLLEKKVR